MSRLYIEQDLLRNTLASSLFHSFLDAGYSQEEASKLRDISITPVSHALDLAHAVYKLHIEAIENWPINIKAPRGAAEREEG